MPRDTAFHTPQRPAFSTLSSTNNMAYGADWPEWQRDLHPVTYERDDAYVRRALAECRAAVATQRRLMFSLMKHGHRAAAGMARRRLDDLNRYVRNCEVQLRLIDATRAYLAGQRRAA